MASTEYITVQGDRWDSIAYKAYGDSAMFTRIADANPNVPMTDVFPGGLRLIIPIVEDAANTSLDMLPPWKRVQSDLAAKTESAVELIKTITSVPASFDKSFD